MDFDLYARLIQEGAAKGLQSVKLNFLGEPLLYPKLPEMVKLAAQKSLWVMLNTNAVALTYDLGKRLLLAGLTDIFFSFDSPYPKEYEAIRQGAKYKGVLDNIAAFMELKDSLGLKGLQTRASMVLPEDPEGREEIKADYVRLFRRLKVAEIGFGLPTIMDRDYASLNPPTFVCPDLFRRIFVYQDGVYGPCCGDWSRKIPLGDADSFPLIADLWNSAAYQSLRAAHKDGAYRTIPACLTCSVPYLSTVDI
jgi:hypothetical protein